MACQPVWGYFKLRGKWITFIFTFFCVVSCTELHGTNYCDLIQIIIWFLSNYFYLKIGICLHSYMISTICKQVQVKKKKKKESNSQLHILKIKFLGLWNILLNNSHRTIGNYYFYWLN